MSDVKPTAGEQTEMTGEDMSVIDTGTLEQMLAELDGNNDAPSVRLRKVVTSHLLESCFHEELRHFHDAAVAEAYRILGIDGSDGEFRMKWVFLEASCLVKEKAEFEQEARSILASHEDLAAKYRALADELIEARSQRAELLEALKESVSHLKSSYEFVREESVTVLFVEHARALIAKLEGPQE